MKAYVTSRDNIYNIPNRYPFLKQFIMYTDTNLMYFSHIRINEYMGTQLAETNNHITYGILNRLLHEGVSKGDWDGSFSPEVKRLINTDNLEYPTDVIQMQCEGCGHMASVHLDWEANYCNKCGSFLSF